MRKEIVDVLRESVDQLPNTGVQISVMIFGGLALLILGGGLLLTSRRRHHHTPPPPSRANPSPHIDLILSQRPARGLDGGGFDGRGFDRDAIGQANGEGGESGS